MKRPPSAQVLHLPPTHKWKIHLNSKMCLRWFCRMRMTRANFDYPADQERSLSFVLLPNPQKTFCCFHEQGVALRSFHRDTHQLLFALYCEGMNLDFCNTLQ